MELFIFYYIRKRSILTFSSQFSIPKFCQYENDRICQLKMTRCVLDCICEIYEPVTLKFLVIRFTNRPFVSKTAPQMLELIYFSSAVFHFVQGLMNAMIHLKRASVFTILQELNGFILVFISEIIYQCWNQQLQKATDSTA